MQLHIQQLKFFLMMYEHILKHFHDFLLLLFLFFESRLIQMDILLRDFEFFHIEILEFYLLLHIQFGIFLFENFFPFWILVFLLFVYFEFFLLFVLLLLCHFYPVVFLLEIRFCFLHLFLFFLCFEALFLLLLLLLLQI